MYKIGCRGGGFVAGMAVVLLVAASTPAADEAPSQDDLRRLEATIAMLRAQVKAQAKEIAKLRAKLRALNTGTPTSQPQAVADSTGWIPYRGLRLTPKAVDALWKRYRWLIVLEKGRYYDVSERINDPLYVSQTPPKVGDIRQPGSARIFQVIGKGQALCTGLGGDPTFYVEGLGPDRCVEDRTFNARLIYTGTYKHTTVMGAPATVQAYRLHRLLTRSEFVRGPRLEIPLRKNPPPVLDDLCPSGGYQRPPKKKPRDRPARGPEVVPRVFGFRRR